VPEAPRAGPEAIFDRVDAAFDPTGPPATNLVAHGVGEGLDRCRTGDAVAVDVEERLQLGQRERAVAAQDGQARRPQRAAPEEAVLGG
jgi:hypothetical protein